MRKEIKMKPGSQFLYVLALAVVACASVSPARAEAGFPHQFSIEARMITPCHRLKTATSLTPMEADRIDEVINFNSNNDKLTPTAKMQIKHVAMMLKSPAYQNKHVMINGY